MPDTSVDQMRHLRSQARKLGLKIQTRRATASEPVRYRVVDPATGAAIGSDLVGLDDIQARLWWIVRDRDREQAGEPHVPEDVELCPACGTPRMGFFRLCMTCGLDYEARVKAPAAAPAFSTNGIGNGTHVEVADPTTAEPWLAASDVAASDVAAIPGPGIAVVADVAEEPPELPPMRELHDLPKGPNILVRTGYGIVDLVGTLGKVAGWVILVLIAVGLVTLFANSMR